MPLIWCAISGHGYGHAAQVVPVLNELGRLVPSLRAILRTPVPASFFRDRLTIPWDLQPVHQDVGCVQRGPIQIDVPATWAAHLDFHTEWDQRLSAEISALQSARPHVILADTPYLACAAGAMAGIPTVALASLTWDEVLEPFASPGDLAQQGILSSIRGAYGQADLALRITPGLPMRAFRTVRDIGPIAQPAASQRAELRTHLNVDETERVVLVGFGGIPLTSLPLEQMAQMTGYRFIVDGVMIQGSSRFVGLPSLPFTFKTILASVDVIMTKPGYGTIVEAVALGTPVLYVRRYNFADEQLLVDFLHQHGHGMELSLDDFQRGRWAPALARLLKESAGTSRHPVAPTGAEDAANLLRHYLIPPEG